jgi:hypothetical protein
MHEIRTDRYIHKIFAEKTEGLKLMPWEVVHQINWNKIDYDLNILEIVNRFEDLWINRCRKFNNNFW